MLGTPTSTRRKKSHTPNKTKQQQKKLEACSRETIEIVEKKGDNFRLYLNTASFEEVRNIFLGLLHINPSSDRSSRHVVEMESDMEDNIQTEIYTINNWAAIFNNTETALQHRGECFIVINLYRTQSSCPINGGDAAAFMLIAGPVLKATLEDMEPALIEQN